MNDLFQQRVRSAAVAGWWTFLVGVAMAMLFWACMLLVARGQPEWVTRMWGGVSWETMRDVSLWMIAVFRLLLWVIFLVAVWLSLWSAKLKRLK